MLGDLVHLGDQAQAELDHQRGHDLRQAMEHFVFEKVVEPVHRRLATEQFHAAQDEVARRSSDYQCDEQEQQECQEGVNPRVLSQGIPEILGVEPELFEIHRRKRFFCRMRPVD
ncbi:hypothetical protein D3C85_1441030 [compost metagenome]